MEDDILESLWQDTCPPETLENGDPNQSVKPTHSSTIGEPESLKTSDAGRESEGQEGDHDALPVTVLKEIGRGGMGASSSKSPNAASAVPSPSNAF